MDTTIDCTACGGPARLVGEQREHRLGHLVTDVADEYFHCDACGEDFYTPELAEQVHARAVRQLHAEGRLLLPAEIRTIRERHALTQGDFERLLGTGANTVSRWENGHVIPNASADALLRLLEADPENVRRLARLRGVELSDAA